MKINKILLMVPPAFTFKSVRDINPLPPMGLGYLASIIEGLGIGVDILDCLINGWEHEEPIDNTLVRVGLSDSEIENYIKRFNPDMVGVTCNFSRQYKIYHRMFSLIKKIKPECITVAGGAHVTVCPEEVLKDPACDFILIGEAEESFKALISGLVGGKELTPIDGLGWKCNGELRINPKNKWISDLDSIGFPAYHIMKLEKYFGLKSSHGIRHKNRFSPIITSRGCPAKCTFCSAHMVWGNKYRLRTVDNVIEEMRLLKNKYGIEELMFEDDNVTASPKRAKELFSRMIAEKFDFIWDTPNGVGVWSIDENMLDLMKQSGCINVSFPVESGSQYVLDNIVRKPLKLSKVKKLIKYCRKIKLNYNMYLVIGMPGEKVGNMWETFRFAADNGCYAPHVSVATPYPGTHLFKECMEKKYFSREFTLEDLFIRGFMIRTPEWNENKIKKVLSRGYLYLEFRRILNNPFIVLKKLFNRLKQPVIIATYIKRVSSSF